MTEEKELIVGYLLANQGYGKLNRAIKIVCKLFIKGTKNKIRDGKIATEVELINLLQQRESFWRKIANSFNNQQGAVFEVCPDWFSNQNINGIVLSELQMQNP